MCGCVFLSQAYPLLGPLQTSLMGIEKASGACGPSSDELSLFILSALLASNDSTVYSLF